MSIGNVTCHKCGFIYSVSNVHHCPTRVFTGSLIQRPEFVEYEDHGPCISVADLRAALSGCRGRGEDSHAACAWEIIADVEALLP